MIDKTYKRKIFNRAASSYEKYSHIQDKISQNLLEKFDNKKNRLENILDLGCGIGKNGIFLQDKFQPKLLVNFDIAENMLKESRKKIAESNKKFNDKNCTTFHICGDMENIPFNSETFDLVWSSSAIQWCNNLSSVFKHIRRILKPNGFLIFSTFAPGTLEELRLINQKLSDQPKTNNFFDINAIREFANSAGFQEHLLDQKTYRLKYTTIEALLSDIRGVGATSGNNSVSRGLRGRDYLFTLKKHYDIFIEKDLYPATYKVIYGVLYNNIFADQ